MLCENALLLVQTTFRRVLVGRVRYRGAFSSAPYTIVFPLLYELLASLTGRNQALKEKLPPKTTTNELVNPKSSTFSTLSQTLVPTILDRSLDPSFVTIKNPYNQPSILLLLSQERKTPIVGK